MKRHILLLLALVVLLPVGNASAKTAKAKKLTDAIVEPLCWWTGMKQPLQLLVHADGIGACDVSVKGLDGVSVTAVHKADSPNYLFVDLAIDATASAGTFDLLFTSPSGTWRYPYTLYERAEGSALRQGFSTADMIYLIMPDRFANGDPTNDATPSTIEGPNRKDSFGRHGGDIQGIIDHLDYLSNLGVTAIWCTPLTLDNERHASFHGYACSDYYHIDPRYGTNDLYREYVSRCHALGIKVITDFVPNHCGAAHWWMKDLPFTDWVHQFPEYTGTNICFSTNMDPNASTKDLYYQESGWFAPSMPDMNLDNPFVLQYFQQLAIWWVEWSGLDGIRIDTYPYNEKVPGSRLCQAIMDEYPGLNIVGECWTQSVPQLAYWQGGAANEDGFDSHLPSIMDFPLRDALIRAMREDKPGWGEGMTRIYDALSHDFAYHDLSHMMIFAANHDTERVGDVCGQSVGKMKILTTLLATLRGIPQTYFGDEQMFVATKDRGDSAWRREFSGGWAGDDVNLFTAEGRNAEQNDLYDFNCRLWQWRKTSAAVQQGRTLHFLSRDNTYAYFRYLPTAETNSPSPENSQSSTLNSQLKDNSQSSILNSPVKEAVFVYINNTNKDRQIPWSYYDEITPRLSSLTATDVFTGNPVTLSDGTVVPAGTALLIDFR